MIQFQVRTGARPGDTVSLRLADIDMTGNVWEYRPWQHKTAYLGHERVIYIGPEAQELLREYLDRPATACIFLPREAEAERRVALHAERRTPLSCGNGPGTNRKRRPKREPGERYTAASYRRAIQRACEKAGVPKWHPHQLRHNAGTIVRAKFGLEATRNVLGLRTISMAELYAQRDKEEARKVAEDLG